MERLHRCSMQVAMFNARTDAPWSRSAAEVAADLETDLALGLTHAQALQRLQTDGPNALAQSLPAPLLRRLLPHFQSPLIYLLLAAVVITLLIWIIDGGSGWPVDAIVIAVIIVFNAALGYLQEARAEHAIAALARMTTVMAGVIRSGQVLRIPSVNLVRGDILVLNEGDAVGADARLIAASSLRLQQASLTGESEAVTKDARTLASPVALAERSNMLFKGTAVVRGSARAIVTATGMATEVGAIAHMLAATEEQATTVQKELQRIGRMLGCAVIVIALIVMASIWLVSDIDNAADAGALLLFGVALAVAAVPEGLPAILSVVLAIGVQRIARRNAIIKKLSSVETLGSASVICVDKTGTLTRSEMTILRTVTASGATRVTGVGYAPQGQFEHEGALLQPGDLHAEHIVLLGAGSLAGNADLREGEGGVWEIRGDPTEAAFLVAERKLGGHQRRARRFERVAEIAFTSERKMMSTIEIDHEDGDARVLISKGAPDILLERCTRIRIGMGVAALTPALRARALADVDSLSDEALRTLAVAYRPLAVHEVMLLQPKDGPELTQELKQELEQELIYVGSVGIIDPPRPEAGPAIAEAHRAGIRIVMITGDHPRTAARIAADLGIVVPGTPALSGVQLDALDDAAFALAVRRTAVFARVAPLHKLRIVAALQADGNIVAMTGDGVNDAPALKAADIGIAMGITGTEVAKEAARMILLDDNFATIVVAVREGRAIFDNIRKFLRYLLSSNMGEVLTVFLGVLGARAIGLFDAGGDVVLPLLATQILWINLITDSAPALALGIDVQTDDLMARPPRHLDQRFIDAPMWAGVLQVGLVMALATLLTIDICLPGGLVEGAQSLERARSAGFTVLVFGQLFNCFNARSETRSAFHRLWVNRALWGAVLLSVLLQVAVVEWTALNPAFGTAPLTLAQWLLCVAMSSAVLWLTELRKLAARWFAR
jgi:magnesium-transporting ATPase (P-type)